MSVQVTTCMGPPLLLSPFQELLAFFPQNVPGIAEYTPCSKSGHLFEDNTD